VPAGREIERKYLVRADRLPADLETYPHEEILQGYLAAVPDGNEVRLRRKGERYYLTVKSQGGLTRREGEIQIGRPEFETLWPFAGRQVVGKVRYRIPCGGTTIELDLFGGRLEGLAIAEVEFGSEAESDAFAPPDWLGAEVTEDPRYRNESLARCGRPADDRGRG
jgi:adenylate cyclase